MSLSFRAESSSKSRELRCEPASEFTELLVVDGARPPPGAPREREGWALLGRVTLSQKFKLM